eukprot:3468631-Rhodomonas_salina.3
MDGNARYEHWGLGTLCEYQSASPRSQSQSAISAKCVETRVGEFLILAWSSIAHRLWPRFGVCV